MWSTQKDDALCRSKRYDDESRSNQSAAWNIPVPAFSLIISSEQARLQLYMIGPYIFTHKPAQENASPI